MKILTFPKHLRKQIDDGTAAHMSFQVFPKDNPEGGAKVHLYMPTGISVPDSAGYTSVDLGAIGAAKSAGSGEAEMTEADVAIGGLNLLKGKGGTAEAFSTTAGLEKGIVSNPFTNIAFQSTTVRTFAFTFKLVSESADEAEEARQIENFFRKNLYPKKLGVFALQYPPTFKIRFYTSGSDESKFLPFIQDCYLVNATTSYNETANIFHTDGAPVETSIALSFQETKNLTRDDLYGTGEGYDQIRGK